MTSGPPTPPPTTAAELIDEARTRPPNLAPAELPQPSSSQDPFLLAFPTIARLATQQKYHELIQIAEQTEINSDGDQYRTRLCVITPLVLAYLIVDDLPPARHVLTRLPENIMTLPLCQALLNLLASTRERNYAMVYSLAENLFHMIEQSDSIETNPITSMVKTFVEHFRHRTFVLLSKAYTSMPLSLAQMYLGLPSDQLLAVSEQNGWSYDASTHILTPSTASDASQSMLDDTHASSLDTICFVADSVSKLEM